MAWVLAWVDTQGVVDGIIDLWWWVWGGWMPWHQSLRRHDLGDIDSSRCDHPLRCPRKDPPDSDTRRDEMHCELWFGLINKWMGWKGQWWHPVDAIDIRLMLASSLLTSVCLPDTPIVQASLQRWYQRWGSWHTSMLCSVLQERHDQRYDRHQHRNNKVLEDGDNHR